MRKLESIQKYSGKRKTPDEEENINSKENVEKIEDAKDEISNIPPIMQIDYDELPDGVYDFAGLAELQNRRTRPNLKENEKLLKNKIKKEKKHKEKTKKKRTRILGKEENEIFEEQKNIVEEIFEAKKSEENFFDNNLIIEEKNDLNQENVDINQAPEIKQEALVENKTDEIKQEKIIELEKVEDKENIEKIEENKNNEEKKEQVKVEISEDDKSYEKNPELEEKNELIEENQINIPNVEIKESNEFEKEIKNIEPRRKRRNRNKSNRLQSISKDEETSSNKIIDLDSYKKFAFLTMFLLGIVTQISFLATSRENNIVGVLAITLFSISMLLLVNILEIKNKVIIFVTSLVITLLPTYTNTFITGENAISYSFAVLLVLISLNLVFVKNNRIISFVLAVTLFAISYKILENCMEIFLVISIIKIIEDIFNRKERILNFLIHCIMICAILTVIIFL